MSKLAKTRISALLRPELSDSVQSGQGYLNLLDEQPEPTGPAQSLMHFKPLSMIYEHAWRPALGRVAKGVFGPGMEDELRIARLLMALKPGDRVLDIACGTGKFTRSFAQVVGSEGLAIGLDISQPMLDRAVSETDKKGFENVGFVRASALELPFHGDSFNAVCCFAALDLIPDPFLALDQMRSVLVKGGRIALFASARNKSQPLTDIQQSLGQRSGLYMFGEPELRDALKDRGFTDVKQKIAGMTQFIGGRLPE